MMISRRRWTDEGKQIFGEDCCMPALAYGMLRFDP